MEWKMNEIFEYNMAIFFLTQRAQKIADAFAKHTFL